MAKTVQEQISGIRTATKQNKITPAQMADVLDGIYDEAQKGGVAAEASKLDADITANNAVGGIPIGKTYTKGTSVVDIVKDALFSYKTPSVVCSGGLSYEIGSNNSPLITYGGGDSSSSKVVKIELYRGSTLISEATKTSAGTFTYRATNVTTDTTFTCKVYDETKGTGTIAASSSTTFTFGRKYFVGCYPKDTLPTDSVSLRALTKFSGILRNGANTIVTSTTTSDEYYLLVAVPSGCSISVQNSLGGPLNPNGSYTGKVYPAGDETKEEINYTVFYFEGTPTFKNLKITL